ncbi:uncharacterized protein C8R40DRAFT_1136815 [Lentinula edodes]|uniref:uncharacterized protein n=1 Tax=Lentinula edodes TaxID=5353 RepID=UPI001E8DB4EC|nr:uncharacterized protein C8R40DRAFT_1136815 [Lentinula edodes]KAH7868000.1 hypothetical protein C8R40DRAFT_1136815 [Lentinula edodes]
MSIMSNHTLNITRPGRSVSSDRGREHRSPMPWSSNTRFPRPLSTPPGLKAQIQDCASSSLSRSSLSGGIGIEAGYWNWDPEKAEVVFCRKSNNLEYTPGSRPTKSPAKVTITTKSPAMAFVLPEPSNSLRRLSSSMIDSSSRPYSPTPVFGFASPSLAVRGLASKASPVTLSSPPPLHFNSDFTGWLLPDGVDTSIPDDNSELPDLTDSSFTFASSSNPDLNTSTISSNSEYNPPTPGRGIGLGFGLGFAHTSLSGCARVFCYDNEISQTFLKETAFDAADVSNGAITPLEVQGSYGGGCQSGYSEAFDFPTAPCFEGKNGEKEYDSTLKLPSETISNSKGNIPCLSLSSTPRNRTSSSSLFPCPSSTSPSLRRHSRSQVTGFSSVSSSKRPEGCSNENSVSKPTTSKPAAAKRGSIRRTISLHRRGGPDVTLATISSSLKRSTSSGSSSPTITVPTANRLFSRVPSRILGRGPREAGADLKKMKGCPAVTVHPRYIPQKQAKAENGPKDVRSSQEHRGRRRSLNAPSSERKLSWK